LPDATEENEKGRRLQSRDSTVAPAPKKFEIPPRKALTAIF
jgi:hypothetical protein